jgi:ubiquinone/menaquinone biosynthesis C-methylase UbiE
MNLKILIASLLEKSRKRSEQPLERLREIGLKEGMVFLDVGCTLGFYSFPAASIVGEKGLVYALDINPSLIAHVEDKVAKEEARNVKLILASAEETGLPANSVDIVFLHLVLHDIKSKEAAVKEFNRILRTRGRLVIDEEDAMPLDAIEKLTKEAGFGLSKTLRKTVQIFEKKDL